MPTISLNDVFVKYFNGERIDYMSVDTEGSEFLILSNFNFGKYGPKVVTVEHNFTSSEKKLDALFKENKYIEYGKAAKENSEIFNWDNIIESYKRIL